MNQCETKQPLLKYHHQSPSILKKIVIWESLFCKEDVIFTPIFLFLNHEHICERDLQKLLFSSIRSFDHLWASKWAGNDLQWTGSRPEVDQKWTRSGPTDDWKWNAGGKVVDIVNSEFGKSQICNSKLFTFYRGIHELLNPFKFFIT